jgi:PPOX class probable F420-dependent enzyme
VARLPEVVRRKLEEPSFWQFVTINADGSPTATPVWVDVDGDHVIVNTAIGRLKERNVRRDPRVVLALADRDDPYAWMEIRGRVIESVEGKAADDCIDRLSRKYLGLERYATRKPGERRIMFRIEPTAVNYRTEAGSRPDELRAKLKSDARASS